MITLWSIVNNWVTTHNVRDRIVVLVKDLIAFRKRASHMVTSEDSKIVGGFMTVCYHHKGIEMSIVRAPVRALGIQYPNF